MISSILVIGLNHATAPVEIREKITFPGNEEGRVARRVLDVEGVEEAIILSTCNRAEIIGLVEDPEATAERLVAATGSIHGLAPELFRTHLYVKQGPEAVRHVFRVASSLDSMVLGEPQILGQVKEAYRRASRAGTTGPILNRLMHRSFFTAKRVRSETGIGLSAVSVAYVAVELAEKILGNLKDKSVLLVGAGEMAEMAARHLVSQVEKPLLVVNRTYQTACGLACQFKGSAMPMEQIEEGLISADVVITSTGSCEPVITYRHMKEVMRKRRYRPVFLIDIAIPRDVEITVNDLDGVYLYNIDDLQAVVDENVGERRQEALRGEAIVAQEVSKFMEWTRTLSAIPTIVAVRRKLETVRASELARLNGKLSRLAPEDRETVEMITRAIINKIAHDPISFLKKVGKRSRSKVYLDIAQRLFNLDETEVDLDAYEGESTDT